MTDADPSSELDALLARTDEVVLLVDARLRLVRAGPPAADLARRPLGELTGMSLIAAFGSGELDRIARQALVTSDVANGESQLGGGGRTFRIEALPAASGGLVIGLRDVTALRQLERVRRDLIANISHELRTPLASVRLLVEELASEPDEAARRRLAGQAEREVDHLTRVVDQLLDLARMESGEMRLAMEAVDPAEAIDDVIERLRPLADRTGVTLRALPPVEADSISAAADRARLGQALVNLAHNAIKFSHPGGEVRLGWCRAGGAVRFTVADDGVGIPPGHRARIFERFYKIDRSRARAEGVEHGVGLGLSIVRHIAEAHGGAVGVESREGAGSTFWIELPAAAS